MTLLVLVVTLVVVGVLLWAVQAIPMDAAIRNILRVVVIVAVVLWLAASVVGGEAGFNPRLW